MTQHKKVLIVDDEEPIRGILSRWLDQWGHKGTRAVGNASDAMDAMAADPADILLCDVNMPGHDGLWLVEQVQTCWPQTAIVMSTGRDDPTTIRASRLGGAIAYVTKPFDQTLLRQALERAAGLLRVRPSAEPPPHAEHPSKASPLGPDGAIRNPLNIREVLKRGDAELPKTE